ncbi:U2 snRNP complex subunit [Pyricularia oryzae]|uniref:U2 small nuclear ribonucleoprotein A' n=3 Tax=Pyricularia TaxID=48558 RepID=A0ABQ8NR34_PYRGI|nr:U2 small nuclear ribonucleoprotein A [Pyricularia oryzae 70-15]KAH8847413.1 U2 snRNP complex subunit [Pyricularia oryzae]KAI6300865.1 U2 snRNP complex subunit [Pyricularia grisea]EHA52164.1 U2 small nuclear ribonucleoprotein A [Pyricularia oryzae 70-15]KAH9428390.1 U2 snRNP complex subunit [Pyricularia oryzae]KAI6259992.1 U2 snRNP complex subunit [Pyricularia oryzae]
MRLNADLINHSLSYLNPLKERELDLRGHRIPAIENLGVAGPQDAIDFTDNDILTLGNFPLSPRIRTLLLARNRIVSIQPALANAIPNLTNLQLASNNLSELADLDPLKGFKKLTHLVLMDNPVAKKENYRYWVLWRCPSVRFLDFQKVKQAEREHATEIFGTEAEPTELALKIIGTKASSLDKAAKSANAPSTAGSKLSRIKLTDEERQRLQERIKNAKSLDEILRLEKELNEGRLPAGIHASDMMEE